MTFEEISDDVRLVFDEIVAKTDLGNLMNIYYCSVPRQKGVVKVSKLNPIGEMVSKRPMTIVITVVEKIFERLNPKQQQMIAEDVISQVSYDYDKDKIVIESPAITMNVSTWQKYGDELANAYETSYHTAQMIEEEEKERKAAEKEAKKFNRNN